MATKKAAKATKKQAAKPAKTAKPARTAKPAKAAKTAKPAKAAKPAKTAKPTRNAATNNSAAKITKRSSTKAAPLPGGPAPEAGALAPDFTLPGTDGQTHTLSALRGKSVVVYFYPRDDTPGCTREAQGFEAASAAFAAKGAVVFGVSKDSIESHCRFQAKYGLGFVLLSDPSLTVHRAYGAYGEKVMYGQKTVGVIRSTFLVGPSGRISRAWPRVKVDGHVESVLSALG